MTDNKTWSGRFNEPVAELVKKYTGSIDFDKRLAKWDIQGSLAHAQMLQQAGVLSAEDLAAIEQGMAEIIAEIEAGKMPWLLDLEDVHMNIERRLTDKIGDAGKRLHTGRSRNDQVATDIRLWLRDEITEIQALLQSLQAALLDLAEQNAEVVMPGFTHLQVAQPVSFGHHMLAYVEMLGRDHERMADCRRRVNRMPLGAAALAGTTYPIRRETTAQLLGFEQICQNSLDAVSDRDFAIEFTAAASLVMIHLSRLSEELILWMSPRFGFIDIADRFCTGSSIMPQKKNPDVPELVRGKSGRVIGHLTGLMMLMKSQPLAYNKDNQEDKEPLFDTVDTLDRHLAHLCRHDARRYREARKHARGRDAGLCHRHRFGRLSGEKRHAFPRQPRSGGAGRAPCRPRRRRFERAAARRSAKLFRFNQRRCLQRAHARGQPQCPQPLGRHRARASAPASGALARPYRRLSRSANKKIYFFI
jgi:argininosuccinate lyase